LHKSIDLPDLLGCPAVSIHLWMHAYSKLQCPQAELWVANRYVSLSLPLSIRLSHLLPIPSHPLSWKAEGYTTEVTSTLVIALYWIVNDTSLSSLFALPKNISTSISFKKLHTQYDINFKAEQLKRFCNLVIVNRVQLKIRNIARNKCASYSFVTEYLCA